MMKRQGSIKRLNKILSLIAFLIPTCLFLVSAQSEEKLTIVTYYPSPYGSYRELKWGQQPDSGATLTQTGSIELGGDGIASQPFISFSASKAGMPDDALIKLTDPNNLTIKSGDASDGTVRISRNLWVDGVVTIAGGNPGANKVLTSSNSEGLASWQSISTPQLSCRVVTNWNDQSDAWCAADEFLTGGGCYWQEIEDAGNDEVRGYPTIGGGSTLGQGWICRSDSGDATDTYAVCCKLLN